MANKLDINSFATDDSITRIFLIERGIIAPDTNKHYRSSSKEIASYVNYLLSTLDLMEIEAKATSQETSEKVKKLFVKVHEYISDDNKFSGIVSLNEAEFLDMFTKIKTSIKNNSDIELSNKYLEFLGECSNSNENLKIDWSKFSGSDIYTHIPTMDCVYSRDKDELEFELTESDEKYLKKVLKDMRSDRYFNKDYRIKRVFKPETPPHIIPDNIKREWKKQTVLHGTSNFAILGILNSNFNLSRVSAGRALGNGVYFARTDQSSKPLYYLDHQVKGSRYMFICDIYYKYFQEVRQFNSNLKYNGKNMVWGKDLGAYSRDELVVLPQQIEVRYVVELAPR